MPAQDVEALRRRLYAIAADRSGDLAEGALLIAAEDDPALDTAPYLEFVASVARAVARGAPPDRSPLAWRDAMAEEIFGRQGFRGDAEDYYDPRNSYLNQVIDRRRGIPITLSIVYIAVGARLGLPVAGVNAPGHFLVRHGDDIVDPFHAGRIVARDGLLEQLRQMGANDPEADLRRLLSFAPTPRAVLSRVLGNLKANYLKRGEMERALSVVDRLVSLNPGNPAELRDRGVIYQHLECPRAAAADLERYLELVPDDPDADVIRNAIAKLNATADRLH